MVRYHDSTLHAWPSQPGGDAKYSAMVTCRLCEVDDAHLTVGVETDMLTPVGDVDLVFSRWML